MKNQGMQCAVCGAETMVPWLVGTCGHGFCTVCVGDRMEVVCPVDGTTSKCEEVKKQTAVGYAIPRADSIEETVGQDKAESVRCPAGIFCSHKADCPYQHSEASDEEDLFQSMAPSFPDPPSLAKSDSVKSGLPSEVLNEYLDIEGDDGELQPGSDAYLQALAQTVASKVGTAYQWLVG